MDCDVFVSFDTTLLFLRAKESIGRQEKLKEEHRHRVKVWYMWYMSSTVQWKTEI